MQPPPKTYSWPLLLVVLFAGISLARSAPRQASSSYVIPLPWNDLIRTFNFPESQEKSQEIPEPRALSVNLEDTSAGRQEEEEEDDLQQVLLLTSGLTPAQIAQRSRGRNNEGRFFGRGGTTVVVISGLSGAVNNTNNNSIVTTPATTTTTGTRTSEFIRTPIAYPAGYPMQYYRKRQNDGASMSYPEIFGWNEAAFYGGDLSGLGGLNGGYSLPGVPLVPITVGNEVRYVPMNLRMLRQFVGGPTSFAPPPPPAIREQDDQLEDDDIAALALGPELEVLDDNTNEGGPEVTSQVTGHSVGDPSGFGLLGQRLRPRPLVRRRPLQTLAQNIRRVQYLRK
ncbi:uncharacterized protein LOC6524353 [Drosophila yakuba]|uniref:DUF4794 domain-containing protein n=1 Tax=Drosophila yakuba TaxID=7245 RepID=B4Q0V2_DROYA|nr:uncharacterized protein LOC6524353 [Drosophila yakuba]EDX01319.1 uncharacterized protein Dyak_GE16915 [Drosophila yakuba]